MVFLFYAMIRLLSLYCTCSMLLCTLNMSVLIYSRCQTHFFTIEWTKKNNNSTAVFTSVDIVAYGCGNFVQLGFEPQTLQGVTELMLLPFYNLKKDEGSILRINSK